MPRNKKYFTLSFQEELDDCYYFIGLFKKQIKKQEEEIEQLKEENKRLKKRNN